MAKHRLRLTVSVEYDADPANYSAVSAEGCASIDQREFDKNPDIVLDLLSAGDDLTIKVEAVR